jgi:hypothetical protein
MKKGIAIVVSVLLFIFSFLLLVVPKNIFLSRLSPQGTINPAALQEEFIEDERTAYFNNNPLLVPAGIQSLLTASKPVSTASYVLGEATAPKRLEIDLTNQRLYAYEGDRMIYNFLVSTGKWGKTPTGVFEIWVKLRATKMSGGKKELGTYYNLPNVPYVMYFHNAETPKWRGFGIHGAYWHNNFGHPMSHGCVNMKPEEAGLVYDWAQPDLRGKSSIYTSDDNRGTQVVIYGEAPTS